MTAEHYSVEMLRDYLLGQLSEPETERLDELSITDDECADRLRAVEHDLVDAFVRGELHGATLEQFRSRYLTTPRGADAVRFAKGLQSVELRPLAAHAPPATVVREKRRWPERLALAAAIVTLATASAWLVRDNMMLRARVTSVEASRDELLRDRQRRAAETATAANTAPRTESQGSPPLTIATLVLAPQLRSARQLPAVTLGKGTSELPVRLDLEPVDYPSYEASLIASSSNRQLWRAERLTAQSAGGRQTIDLRLPATLLAPQDYLIRVSGVPARGASETVGEYRFSVVK
jgi:hypothetical protein